MTFPIIDALGFTGRPTTVELGLVDSTVIYQQFLYEEGQEPGMSAPLRSHVEELVEATVADYVILDDESAIPLAEFAEVIGWCRQVRPNVQFGAYGYGPLAIDGLGFQFDKNNATVAPWRASNDALEVMIDAVDILCPAYYFKHGRLSASCVNRAALTVEARRIGQGKPLFPFVWPAYIETLQLPKAEEFAGSQKWRRYLDFLKTGCMEGLDLGAFWAEEWRNAKVDGIVLWSNAVPWPGDDAPWWLETQAFMAADAAEVAPTYVRY